MSSVWIVKVHFPKVVITKYFFQWYDMIWARNLQNKETSQENSQIDRYPKQLPKSTSTVWISFLDFSGSESTDTIYYSSNHLWKANGPYTILVVYNNHRQGNYSIIYRLRHVPRCTPSFRCKTYPYCKFTI